MINATQEYQAAIVGSPRRIEILAVVDLADPDLQWGEVTASPLAPWSKRSELHDKIFDPPARYATLERCGWLLDGTRLLFPADYAVSEPMAVATDELSGADGSFENPQWVEQAFQNVDVLQACSVFFSTDPLDGVPADFTVEVLQGGTAYHTATFTDNRETRISLEGFTVNNPDAIRVTVTRWSLPGRRMRIVDILTGVFEKWGGDLLASFTAVHQGSFSCLSLPYGSVTLSMDNKSRRFEPRRKGGLFQSIEDRQGIQVYLGVRTAGGAVEQQCLGIFYQSGDGWRTSDNSMTMQWDLVDIIGLLADRTFILPDTLPTTLSGWLAALVGQLGESFVGRWHVDPDYADTAVTANDRADVSDKKCGDILRWACMASGTWPRADAETGDLTAEPLWNQGNKVTLENLVSYPTMKANESLAALIFKLADGSNTELVVSGNATSSEKTVTIVNPFIHTQEQALSAARQILSCYGGNIIETTGRGDPSSEIGDVDTIWLDESQATTARRMYQTFTFQNGVLQGCLSRMLQADGSYLWTEFAVITESGKWKAPAGVNQLRVVIWSGGQGGARGQDGYVSGSGEQGQNGQGGFVWYGVININEEQEFDAKLGAGGAASNTFGVPGELGEHSTFGVYSSEDGKLYPNGYTDIANGQVFCRTGVAAPMAGSGDGGKGGDGGDPGEGYYKASYKWYENENGEWVQDYNWQTGWKFIVTKNPGPGKPGVAGATGGIMVTWEKVSS